MMFSSAEEKEIRKIVLMELKDVVMEISDDIQAEETQEVKDMAYSIIYKKILPRIFKRLENK